MGLGWAPMAEKKINTDVHPCVQHVFMERGAGVIILTQVQM